MLKAIPSARTRAIQVDPRQALGDAVFGKCVRVPDDVVSYGSVNLVAGEHNDTVTDCREQVVFGFTLMNASADLFIELNSYEDIAAYRPIDANCMTYPGQATPANEGTLTVKVALGALEAFFEILEDSAYHGTTLKFDEAFVLLDHTGVERNVLTAAKGAPLLQVQKGEDKSAIRRIWDRITRRAES